MIVFYTIKSGDKSVTCTLNLEGKELACFNVLREHSNYTYINVVARKCNVSHRDAFELVSCLRQRWVPIVGSSHWVKLSTDATEVLRFADSLSRKATEDYKKLQHVARQLRNSCKEITQTKIVPTTRVPWYKRDIFNWFK